MIQFPMYDAPFWFDKLMGRTQIHGYHQQQLRLAYLSHGRAYHGLYHIASLWCYHIVLWHAAFQKHSDAERKLANAIACHDVVYNPRSKTNEIESANWFRCCLDKDHEALPSEAEILWTSNAIEATADHFAERPTETEDDMLLQWFLGLDLLSLAAPWEVFAMDTLKIRAEYAHLTDEEWATGRQAFFEKVLTGPIYRHPFLADLFESKARANIERALKPSA